MQFAKIVPVVLVFFGGLLIIGLLCFNDYGISWDAPVQREYGGKVYRFLTQDDPELFSDRHRYYGPVVEVLLYWLEEALSLTDTREVFLMRHLVTFLISWVGLIFFYLLAKRIFGDTKLALLAPVLLVLSPRIFAHSFFNTKDLPFMMVFIVAVYSLINLVRAKTIGASILHGFACALLIDIRIIGILIVIITLVAFGFDLVRRHHSSSLRAGALSLGSYFGSLIAFTMLMWPTLWHDPLSNFARSYQVMRSFPWQAPILYLGKEVWSTNLPWHYLPVWMAVSSPLAVILLGGLGFAFLKLRLLGKATEHPSRLDALIVLLWFWLPLGYLMFSNVVLYDAWRHAFFVYPALVLAAVSGVSQLCRLIASRSIILRAITTGIVLGGLTLDLGLTLAFMVRNHPHENVYFNVLTGGLRHAEGRFELDYWGLSYRQGLEWIASMDSREHILVNAATAPGRYNAYMLKPEDRSRFFFVAQPSAAYYYITNFRWQRGEPPGRELYSIKVDGTRILGVFGR